MFGSGSRVQRAEALCGLSHDSPLLTSLRPIQPGLSCACVSASAAQVTGWRWTCGPRA